MSHLCTYIGKTRGRNYVIKVTFYDQMLLILNYMWYNTLIVVYSSTEGLRGTKQNQAQKERVPEGIES
jgi:hypothetical protein